jgi:PPOX class probable FMN-dependent enzyme, DR_2398 family
MEVNEMADEKMLITDSNELEHLYGAVAKPSLTKVTDHIHPAYRPFIEASTFVALATSGPDGLDVSPRGDPAGFIYIEDAKTLFLPDRRGNNRIDSLRNILNDNRVALLFLIPGIGETLRISGTAEIRKDPALLDKFAINNQSPKTVLRISVESVFFQCSRAIIRSKLWDPAAQIDRQALPSTGSILSMISQSEIDGLAYDEALPERLKNTLY